jgi:hypothetical protein
MSWHFFSLTFDEAYRLIIRDWGSISGMEVTYNRQCKEFRSNFPWIVGGHDMPQNRQPIKIRLDKDGLLKFELVVCKHDITSPDYRNKVDRFMQGTADTEDLFGQLDLQHPDTRRATGAHTPGTGPLHLREPLGAGAYATVTRVWNVSTAQEYALKAPSAKAIRGDKYRKETWDREVEILKSLSHVSEEIFDLYFCSDLSIEAHCEVVEAQIFASA